MTPRTLWSIILKIFGLYILLQILYALPQLFSTIIFLSAQFYGHDSWKGITITLFTMSVFLFMLIAFLFKTDWLIDKLQLDKSIMEERLEINIHRSTVLRIATIMIGILLIIESLPLLLKESFTYYQEINSYRGFKDYPRSGWIVLEFVKVLISFFMINSSRLIVNFIELKRKNKIIKVPE